MSSSGRGLTAGVSVAVSGSSTPVFVTPPFAWVFGTFLGSYQHQWWHRENWVPHFEMFQFNRPSINLT